MGARPLPGRASRTPLRRPTAAPVALAAGRAAWYRVWAEARTRSHVRGATAADDSSPSTMRRRRAAVTSTRPRGRAGVRAQADARPARPAPAHLRPDARGSARCVRAQARTSRAWMDRQRGRGQVRRSSRSRAAAQTPSARRAARRARTPSWEPPGLRGDSPGRRARWVRTERAVKPGLGRVAGKSV